MKYLSSRTEYLKSANYKVINETMAGAGPFANDIAWGDSLLGRLLNSIIRKAKIGVNLVRIDSVIKRLQEQFDYLVDYSKLKSSEIDKATKLEIDMLAISIQIGTLKESIENSDETGGLLVKEIITQTKNTIYEIKEINLQTPESEPSRKEILVKLNEFLSELELMKDGKPLNTQKEIEKEEKGSKSNIPYHLYISNLKSIRDILNSYKKIKSEKTIPQKNVEDPESKLNKTSVNKVTDKSLVSNESQLQPSTVLESTKSLYNYIMSDPSNLIELDDLVSSFDKMSDENRKKLSMGKYASIKRVYDYIKSNSISENLDNLLSRSEELGKKIKSLYDVSKSGDFTLIKDIGLKNSLISFNKTMNEILEFKPEVIQNENRILKSYKSFTNLFESEEITDETVDVESSDKKSDVDNNYDITIPWNKIFSTKYLEKWVATDELIKKVEDNIKNSKELVMNGTKVKHLIDGIDPIIEIVRIFNRAYKIHTTQTIPGARSGGKVTNRKMAEYTYIGKGSEPRINDRGSGFHAGIGPYRNNVLFNKWENAVTSILSDSKYQELFNKNTIIKVGDADPRDGQVLLKFINSLNDGDRLYKEGAQSKFIEEYFKLKVDPKKLGYTKNEIDENVENANSTKDITVCEFKSVNEFSFNKRTIHSIKNSKGITLYMMLFEEDNDYVYLKYSQSFYHIKSYLKSVVKVDKGSMSTIETKKLPIYYARIDKDLFAIGKNDILKLKSFKIGDFNKDMQSVESKEINFGKIYDIHSLYNNEDLYKLPGDKVTSSGDVDGNKYNEYKNVLRYSSVKQKTKEEPNN